MARVRVQRKTRRRAASSLHRLAVSLEARLANVVCRDVAAGVSPLIFILVQKLLEGEKRILSLLAHNPFPNAPPKYIRADWYQYRFTKPGEHAWWTRTFVAEYFPPMTLHRAPDEGHRPSL